MLLGAFGTLLVLAMATASVTLTLTRASIFRPWRNWIAGKSKVLGTLFSCPYCMSHWVALVLAIWVNQFEWYEIPIVVFVVVTLSAPFIWMIFSAIQGVGAPNDAPEEEDNAE